MKTYKITAQIILTEEKILDYIHLMAGFDSTFTLAFRAGDEKEAKAGPAKGRGTVGADNKTLASSHPDIPSPGIITHPASAAPPAITTPPSPPLAPQRGVAESRSGDYARIAGRSFSPARRRCAYAGIAGSSGNWPKKKRREWPRARCEAQARTHPRPQVPPLTIHMAKPPPAPHNRRFLTKTAKHCVFGVGGDFDRL